MFRRWVALACLGSLAAHACGERAGDPIIARPSDPTSSSGAGDRAGTAAAAGAGGQSTADGAAGGEANAAGAAQAQPEPGGLCVPCESSDTCGDANDACIRQDSQSFCGRDCEVFGCPDGYTCVELEYSRLLQCVPTTSCPVAPDPPPALDEIRQYLLERINSELSARDRPALSASACLDELAQASALAFASTDQPLAKFRDECDPIWPDCECGWKQQTEVAVASYGLDWFAAIERAFASEGFIESLVDPPRSDVGIGFWISGDEAWIALSVR
jgi:hypothetical protein